MSTFLVGFRSVVFGILLLGLYFLVHEGGHLLGYLLDGVTFSQLSVHWEYLIPMLASVVAPSKFTLLMGGLTSSVVFLALYIAFVLFYKIGWDVWLEGVIVLAILGLSIVNMVFEAGDYKLYLDVIRGRESLYWQVFIMVGVAFVAFFGHMVICSGEYVVD